MKVIDYLVSKRMERQRDSLWQTRARVLLDMGQLLLKVVCRDAVEWARRWMNPTTKRGSLLLRDCLFYEHSSWSWCAPRVLPSWVFMAWYISKNSLSTQRRLSPSDTFFFYYNSQQANEPGIPLPRCVSWWAPYWKSLTYNKPTYLYGKVLWMINWPISFEIVLLFPLKMVG